MPRLYLCLASLSILLFTAAQMLIHAQPYDDHEMRDLLSPNGCSAPCFMGIHPGVTTFEETLKLLEESGWVDQIENLTLSISWSWNGKQPGFIDVLQRPRINFSTALGDDEIVSEITLPTQTSIGSIMQVMTKPISFMVLRDSEQHGLISEVTFVSLRYSNLWIQGNTFCPSQPQDVMRRKATITFYTDKDAHFYPEEHVWDNKMFIVALKDLSICKS